MKNASNIRRTHFTNLGASMQPPCADGEGYVAYREDFRKRDSSKWTTGERWIAAMEASIEDFRNRRS